MYFYLKYQGTEMKKEFLQHVTMLRASRPKWGWKGPRVASTAVPTNGTSIRWLTFTCSSRHQASYSALPYDALVQAFPIFPLGFTFFLLTCKTSLYVPNRRPCQKHVVANTSSRQKHVTNGSNYHPLNSVPLVRVLCVLFKQSLPIQRPWRYYYKFSSKSFIVCKIHV